ncbi:FkbM family methyltransferase [Candidatus Pelagibacter sp.]|nr:FkbM family methyltransferase [Candidatus Pelagibacter sp.]
MTKFGLVVLGAHIGIHIKGEIEQILPEKVLLVEPVPHNVVEIKKNLNNLEGITIEQVALSDKNEKRNFYFVKNTSIHKLKKHWSSGIGSFNKQHLLDHKSKRFKIEEEDIDKISIEAIRFKDLVDKYNINQIDKLLVDVEGSEFAILNDIDFSSINIKKIIFEYKHFDGYQTTGKKLEEMLKKFEENGYTTKKIDEENILATKS